MNNEEEMKAMKEGYPIGDFKHLDQFNIGSIGHKTDLGLQLATVAAAGGTIITDDTEGSLEATSKAIEGVVHINSYDDTDKIMEDLRKAAKAGAKMIVLDSHPISLDLDSANEILADAETFEYVPSFRSQLKKEKMGEGRAVFGRQAKTMRKCALPGCEVMHSHNGGYCKAEHCKEHQQKQKGKKWVCITKTS